MKVFSVIKNFFTNLFKNAIEEQVKILLPIAIEAVKKVESNPSILVSSAKRDVAVAEIVAKLVAAEKPVIKRLINLAVEMAVIEVKGLE